MKQAKFALTAVAVLAVIGGALAFKAQRLAVASYFTDTVIAGVSHCTVDAERENFTTQFVANAPTLTLKASLQSTAAPCPVITIYSQN